MVNLGLVFKVGGTIHKEIHSSLSGISCREMLEFITNDVVKGK